MWKWLLGLVVLLIVGSYLWADLGLHELDQQARQEIGGDYLQTELGMLAYQRQGTGVPVVLVHGFSTPSFVWEQVAQQLAAAGHEVISFDHFGRGFSDRPALDYDAHLYRAELTAVIEQLALPVPVALVGYSMGGANVVDFAAEYPALVSRLVLIAPAGYMGASLSAGLLGVPGLGEWFTKVFGKHYALQAIKAEVAAGTAPADMVAKFERQAAFSGYDNALLSTLRHYPMGQMAASYQRVGRAGIPVTAIWGTEDQVVPYSGAAAMAQDVPQLQLVTLDGGNHNITYSRPAEVAVAIVAALTAAEGRPGN